MAECDHAQGDRSKIGKQKIKKLTTWKWTRDLKKEVERDNGIKPEFMKPLTCLNIEVIGANIGHRFYCVPLKLIATENFECIRNPGQCDLVECLTNTTFIRSSASKSPNRPFNKFFIDIFFVIKTSDETLASASHRFNGQINANYVY